MLGEIHDMDVWVEYLEVLLEGGADGRSGILQNGPDSDKYLPGIRFLRGRCRSRRREIFKKFVEFWGVLKQDESLFDILERFVRHDQFNY